MAALCLQMLARELADGGVAAHGQYALVDRYGPRFARVVGTQFPNHPVIEASPTELAEGNVHANLILFTNQRNGARFFVAAKPPETIPTARSALPAALLRYRARLDDRAGLRSGFAGPGPVILELRYQYTREDETERKEMSRFELLIEENNP